VLPTAQAFAIDLDGALGDTMPLWRDWLEDAARVLPVDIAALPSDRGEAAVALDAGAGNWRALLERYVEDRAPVYLRPDAGSSAALRRLVADGARLGVFTDAPLELAQIALAHLGASRRVTAVATGAGALERLRAELGQEATVLTTRDELVSATVYHPR
jgi:phosphoglycolate phosphatase-like HAD superfamily hydrolase